MPEGTMLTEVLEALVHKHTIMCNRWSGKYDMEDSTMKTYTCLKCDKECKWSYQHNNKFCSIACSSKYKSDENKRKFFAGLLIERIDRPTIRRYLAEARGYKCEVCGVSDWQGEKLTLQVDHINGDPSNDKPDNVRLICPNCHSQTRYLGGANKGRGRKSQGLPLY